MTSPDTPHPPSDSFELTEGPPSNGIECFKNAIPSLEPLSEEYPATEQRFGEVVNDVVSKYEDFVDQHGTLELTHHSEEGFVGTHVIWPDRIHVHFIDTADNESHHIYTYESSDGFIHCTDITSVLAAVRLPLPGELDDSMRKELARDAIDRALRTARASEPQPGDSINRIVGVAEIDYIARIIEHADVPPTSFERICTHVARRIGSGSISEPGVEESEGAALSLDAYVRSMISDDPYERNSTHGNMTVGIGPQEDDDNVFVEIGVNLKINPSAAADLLEIMGKKPGNIAAANQAILVATLKYSVVSEAVAVDGDQVEEVSQLKFSMTGFMTDGTFLPNGTLNRISVGNADTSPLRAGAHDDYLLRLFLRHPYMFDYTVPYHAPVPHYGIG